jgi:peptide deformylase
MTAKTELKIITLNDPLLTQHSADIKKINGELGKFIEEMFQSMYKGKGVGLAAVQVGRLIRVFITHLPKDKPRIFINPEIITTSIEENSLEEGCLSIPNLYSEIKRPAYVKVQALNEKGKQFVLEVEEFLARVILHEVDHLNGLLFIDRVPKQKQKQLLKIYQRKYKV